MAFIRDFFKKVFFHKVDENDDPDKIAVIGDDGELEYVRVEDLEVDVSTFSKNDDGLVPKPDDDDGDKVLADNGNWIDRGQIVKGDKDGSLKSRNSNEVGKNGISIGNNAKISKDHNKGIAIGNRAEIDSDSNDNISIGNHAETKKIRSLAIGYYAKANGSRSISIGKKAKADEYASISIGDLSEAKGFRSLAIGRKTKSNKSDSIALGPESKTLRSDELSISKDPDDTDESRFLTGVKDPEKDTDAVNKKWAEDNFAEADSSDKRLKKDIEELDVPIEKILNIPTKKFKWKNNGKADTGTIAQNLIQDFPELVTTDSEGFYRVNYGKLGIYTLSAVKGLYNDLDILKEEVEILKSKVK